MRIPTHFGPYRVVRRLGEGGMGAVYEAVDDSIERRVAIKILLPQYAANEQVVTRFFNEARAANRVDHPSTVRVFESGRLPDGTAFLVMELLGGESLAARLRSNRFLPIQRVIELGWQIATALAAAHERGIIHRDLKPDNLMLIPDPVASGGERVKVLDFGIAKLIEGVPQPTKSNVIMGTPTYMSPEQCKGAGKVDARSDVYSLGVILFEMLAGRPPFTGEGAGEIIGMHLFAPTPELKDLAPHAPPLLADLVKRLLLKDRNQRPNMYELALALAAQRGESTSATTVIQNSRARLARGRLTRSVPLWGLGGLLTLVLCWEWTHRRETSNPLPSHSTAASELVIPAAHVSAVRTLSAPSAEPAIGSLVRGPSAQAAPPHTAESENASRPQSLTQPERAQKKADEPGDTSHGPSAGKSKPSPPSKIGGYADSGKPPAKALTAHVPSSTPRPQKAEQQTRSFGEELMDLTSQLAVSSPPPAMAPAEQPASRPKPVFPIVLPPADRSKTTTPDSRRETLSR